MDLSNISTADLQAIKAGDLTKVSTEGLQELKAQHMAPTPQPGVEMRAPPEGPSGLQHAEDVGSTFLHHPFTAGVGMAENALSGVTGAVMRTGKRMVGSPITGDEGYQPHTEAGKELAGHAGVEGEAISNAYDQTAGTGPLASQFKERVGPLSDLATTAGVVVPALGAAARVPRALSAAGEAVNAPKAGSIPTAVQRQVQRGVEISPSSVQEAQPSTAEHVPGQQTESALEGPDAQRTRILKNAATNNTHINTDLGVADNGHTTPADIDAARGVQPDGTVAAMRPNAQSVNTETPLNVYSRMGSAVGHGRAVTPALAGELDGVATGTQASSEQAVNQINRVVQNYKNKYATNVDGPQMLEDISTLRQRARVGLQSDNLDQQDVGMAHRQVADALEAEMGRHLPPDSQLASDFKGARVQLAKLNDAETALKGGSYDPAVLARLRSKGAPLSGALNDVADASEIAPKDVMHPQKAPAPATESYSLASLAHKGGAILGRGMNKLTGGTNNAAEAIARHVPPAPEPPGAPQGSLTPPPGAAGPSPAQGEMALPEAPEPIPHEHMPGSLRAALHPDYQVKPQEAMLPRPGMAPATSEAPPMAPPEAVGVSNVAPRAKMGGEANTREEGAVPSHLADIIRRHRASMGEGR